MRYTAMQAGALMVTRQGTVRRGSDLKDNPGPRFSTVIEPNELTLG